MESSVAKIPAEPDPRLDQAHAWLRGLGVELQSGFRAVAGDASFRRYFRLEVDGRSLILMDAAPPGEDIRPFMDVCRRLRSAGLHAPEIVHADRLNGFLLLEDLGDRLYRDWLDESNVDAVFSELFDILKTLALTVETVDLPLFSVRKLRRDMDLFPEWYLGRHRTAMPRQEFDALWDGFCDRIIDSALKQPQCFVHRDFHSCNLLRTAGNGVGIIDFQDAVIGPVSYDFVSLVWDRYIPWPRPQIEAWMDAFRMKLGLDMEAHQWRRYCDLMGLQRNIKIVGIFARLHYRDGKAGYLEMIPRFYEYVTGTLRLYPEFGDILRNLEHPECVP